MAKTKKKQTLQVDVSQVKTRTQWSVKPYTRVEKPKTAFQRSGKGRTPYGERRERGEYCE